MTEDTEKPAILRSEFFRRMYSEKEVLIIAAFAFLLGVITNIRF